MIQMKISKPVFESHECLSEPGCEICREYVNLLDAWRLRKFSVPLPHYIKTSGIGEERNYISS